MDDLRLEKKALEYMDQIDALCSKLQDLNFIEAVRKIRKAIDPEIAYIHEKLEAKKD